MKSTTEILFAISKEGSFSERLKRSPSPTPEVEGCMSVPLQTLFCCLGHTSVGGQGPETQWSPDHCAVERPHQWAGCSHHLLGGLECPGARMFLKLGSPKGQEPPLHTSDVSLQRRGAHAGCTRVTLAVGEDKHPGCFRGGSRVHNP